MHTPDRSLSAADALDEARQLTRTAAAGQRKRIEALLDLAERCPDHADSACLSRGNLHFTLGEYDRTLDIGAELADSKDRTSAGRGHNLVGVVQLERGFWGQALSSFERALGLFPEERFKDRANSKNNLGLLSWRLDELDVAAEHFEFAAKEFEDAELPLNAGNVKNNLGMVLQQSGDTERARALFLEAEQMLRGAPGFLANVESNLAALDEAAGDLDLARSRLLDVLATREELGYKRGIAGTCLSLARIEMLRGEVDEAEVWLGRGRSLAEELRLGKHLADATELEASLLAVRGEWEQAYAARLRLTQLRDDLGKEDLRLRIEAAHNRAVVQEARREAQGLREARDVAEAALRARSAFVATTSHELRGPLTVVSGACELLGQSVTSAKDKELVEIALASSSLLQAVIGDVLDLSRLDSGTVRITRAEFDLRALLESLVLMARAIRKNDVTVRARIHPNVSALVLGDEKRVLQVLLNLMSNAIKYTDAGSVEISAVQEEGGIRFTVVDTGIGVPMNLIPTIFEPFTRSEDPAMENRAGSGLGLSISSRLATAIGGRLELEGTSKHGSTFACWLPLETVTNKEASEQAPPCEPKKPRARRVLLVEDDASVSDILIQLLQHLGHNPSPAKDGQEARIAFATEQHEVVLLDLRLPDASGLDLAREFLATPHPPRVVIVSGEADASVRDKALRMGVSEVLLKPVRMKDLVRVLDC